MNRITIPEMMNIGFLRNVRHASAHMLVAGAGFIHIVHRKQRGLIQGGDKALRPGNGLLVMSVMSLPPSHVADARVKRRVEHIDNEIADHEHEREQCDHRHHEIRLAFEDALIVR